MSNAMRIRRSAVLRAAGILAAAGLGVLVSATPSGAHTDFIGADPHDGANLHELPREVRLEFSEQMDPGLSSVSVRGGAGTGVNVDVATGEKPTELVATLPASLAPESGTTTEWTISFRVVSRDGHPVAGTTTFTLRTPVSATQDPDPSDEESESSSTSPDSSTSEPAGQPSEAGQTDRAQRDDRNLWLPLTIGGGVLIMLLLAVATTMRLVGRDREA
ncbi:copper resistance protein CopC [Nocardioides sp. J2M5]|uniref:copper resistance CopC family protein n=1 Tax=Nocardioides palaemonis TaxID=2829810 RepID=UPI001BA52A16|nr:copper resistance CopC family protein [Nocardioides palaemonis]MBS2938486.1 copper resistance protein CopC [Nocardioides palaemonis]MBS2938911.1 copper resistance protein CopC [Nocardioides palaemonis]